VKQISNCGNGNRAVLTRCDERAGSQRACASGPKNTELDWTKISHK
jgi:hypothetical protein